MARSLSYLRKLNEELKEISDETGVDIEEVEDIVDHFLRYKKELITDPRMPKIQITNWGTYKPSINKIERHLRYCFTLYKDERISRDKMCEKIRALWPIRRRLQKEKEGHITWKEWRNKKM